MGREHAHRHTRVIWFEMNAFHLVSLAVMNGSLGLFSVSTSPFHTIALREQEFKFEHIMLFELTMHALPIPDYQLG